MRSHLGMSYCKVKSALCLTSKMSHDHSRRDSCDIRISSREFHSKLDSIARVVTAVVVGSGALFGAWCVGSSVLICVARVGGNDSRSSENWLSSRCTSRRDARGTPAWIEKRPSHSSSSNARSWKRVRKHPPSNTAHFQQRPLDTLESPRIDRGQNHH